MNWFALITLVLIVLKATGYLHFSWWLVFAPVLFSTGMGLGIVIVALLGAALAVFYGAK